MSERKQLEIRHFDTRMVGCGICGETKVGANVYKTDCVFREFSHLCNDCVEQIAEDWVRRKAGGAGE